MPNNQPRHFMVRPPSLFVFIQPRLLTASVNMILRVAYERARSVGDTLLSLAPYLPKRSVSPVTQTTYHDRVTRLGIVGTECDTKSIPHVPRINNALSSEQP